MPLGVLAAVRRGSLIDQIVRIIGLIGYSVPIFWLGLLALVLFYAKLQWVAFPGRLDVVYEYTFTPITGFYLLDAALQGQWDVFYDAFRHIILPASLLGYFSLAYISRMTRSFMLNELAQEYIVAARAKGLSETRIIWGHALRNAAVPMVTVIALSYAGLLEGSVLTETVFSWPGIGLYITNSLQNADMNAVLGGTIVIGSVFIGINLLSDLLYRVLDPRTKIRMSAEAIQSRRDWLLSERPASRMQARLGRAYVAWRRFSANRLAFLGLLIIIALAGGRGLCRCAGALFADIRRPQELAPAGAERRALVRHRRSRPRYPIRAFSSARAGRSTSSSSSPSSPPPSACWSAPSPAMPAAGPMPS